METSHPALPIESLRNDALLNSADQSNSQSSRLNGQHSAYDLGAVDTTTEDRDENQVPHRGQEHNGSNSEVKERNNVWNVDDFKERVGKVAEADKQGATKVKRSRYVPYVAYSGSNFVTFSCSGGVQQPLNPPVIHNIPWDSNANNMFMIHSGSRSPDADKDEDTVEYRPRC